MYAIQEIAIQELRAAGEAGEADAAWATVESRLGVDYSDYSSVAEGVGLLDLDADGRYAYRIIEVLSDEDSYQELEAENLDALAAMSAWVEAGCPRAGNEIEALRRAAVYRADAVPVKVASSPKKSEAA